MAASESHQQTSGAVSSSCDLEQSSNVGELLHLHLGLVVKPGRSNFSPKAFRAKRYSCFSSWFPEILPVCCKPRIQEVS